MENKTQPNASAFYYDYSTYFPELKGLTKREYFAAMAMQGILSNPNRSHFPTRNANDAIEAADALIKTLNDNGNN